MAKRLTTNERQALVDGLVTSNVCCWDESDREVLNSMSDVTLAKLWRQMELAENADDDNTTKDPEYSCFGIEFHTCHPVGKVIGDTTDQKLLLTYNTDLSQIWIVRDFCGVSGIPHHFNGENQREGK